MTDRCSMFRSLFSRKTSLVAAALIGLALATPAVGAPKDQVVKLHGKVESGGTGLAGYQVSLYASFVDLDPSWQLLGSDTSNRLGNFRITYVLPPGLSDDQQPLLFVKAEHGPR